MNVPERRGGDADRRRWLGCELAAYLTLAALFAAWALDRWAATW